MGTVDDFLASCDEQVRPVYEHVVELATAEVPGSQQGTSYGVPALLHRGRPMLGFSIARTHLTVVPFSPAAVLAARPLLGPAKATKGALTFTLDSPLPDEALLAMLRARVAEIDAALG